MGSVRYKGKTYTRGASLAGRSGVKGKLVFLETDTFCSVFVDSNENTYTGYHYEAVEITEPLTTITETTTKEIHAPDGYEFESGEKRGVKEGEYFLGETQGAGKVFKKLFGDQSEEIGNPDAGWHSPAGPRYILRKIKKEPRTFYAVEYEGGYVAGFSREPITIPAPHKVIKLTEVIE